MRKFFFAAATLACLASCSGPKDGSYTLHILTTNDVHGRYFSTSYVDSLPVNSLASAKWYADSLRGAVGAENVILLDAGDCLQGDNAAYYYNFIDTLAPHVWGEMVKDMGYDALTVGNHDIEVGPNVYNRVYEQLRKEGLPYLAANAVKEGTDEPYFDKYTVLRRHGLKILVLGYTNANIKGWLDKDKWEGIDFLSLQPKVQADVDELRAKIKPQVVIVCAHTGSGKGDGSELENQGLDLLGSLRGVDFVVNAHDHSALALQRDSICLLNSGSHARALGHGKISLEIRGGKVAERKLEAGLINIDAHKVDTAFTAVYTGGYCAVKEFTLRGIGSLDCTLRSREAYLGMSPYINLIHHISLKASGAQISFAAPLSYDGTVKAGPLIYNDLFTIYPYENQLFVLKLSGKEIKQYLEYSYDQWIANEGPHALRIQKADDARTGQKGWSFVNRFYNFDSAAGLVYQVDLTKPAGNRICIESLAGGEAFSTEAMYEVAMTSYRANGGGKHLTRGACIPKEELEERVVRRLPEIRELIYGFIQEQGGLKADDFSDCAVIGHWQFVPAAVAAKRLGQDYKMVFGE